MNVKKEITMTSFRVAILILAHKGLEQVMRLISRVSHCDVDIFLHIDKKWMVSDEELSRLSSLNDGRVYLSPKRFSIFLFDVSMVYAELELMQMARKQALANNVPYAYYILLSGQDYPLKSIGNILRALSTRFPSPSLDTTEWSKGNWVEASFNHSRPMKALRARAKAVIDSRIRLKVLNVFSRGVLYIAFTAYAYIKDIFLGTPYARMRKLGMRVAGGSQWFILPENMVDEILEKATHQEFMRIFQDVGSADETFIQTTLLNSSHKNLLSINEPTEVMQRTLTYVDFFGDSRKSLGHPVILTVSNFDQLQKSECLFARKFDSNVDSGILDMIDEHLLELIDSRKYDENMKGELDI